MVIQGHGVGSVATAVEKIFWSLYFFRKERSVSGKKEEQLLSLPSLRESRIRPGSQRRGNELDQIWIQSGFVISKLANNDVVAPYLIITVQWNIQQVTVIILGPRKRGKLLKKNIITEFAWFWNDWRKFSLYGVTAIPQKRFLNDISTSMLPVKALILRSSLKPMLNCVRIYSSITFFVHEWPQSAWENSGKWFCSWYKTRRVTPGGSLELSPSAVRPELT